MAKIAAADDLRRYAEELFAGLLDRSLGVTGGQKNLLVDLMRHSMDNVNFREIVDIHWNK